jgi:hypothetical protein
MAVMTITVQENHYVPIYIIFMEYSDEVTSQTVGLIMDLVTSYQCGESKVVSMLN